VSRTNKSATVGAAVLLSVLSVDCEKNPQITQVAPQQLEQRAGLQKALSNMHQQGWEPTLTEAPRIDPNDYPKFERYKTSHPRGYESDNFSGRILNAQLVRYENGGPRVTDNSMVFPRTVLEPNDIFNNSRGNPYYAWKLTIDGQSPDGMFPISQRLERENGKIVSAQPLWVIPLENNGNSYAATTTPFFSTQQNINGVYSKETPVTVFPHDSEARFIITSSGR